MAITDSVCVNLPATCGRVDLPKRDINTLCLRAAIAAVLAECRVSEHLYQYICEKVKGIWNYEVTVYENAHPDFQSPSIPGRNGLLQRVLPVHEALLLAHRLVAIGLRRVHQEAAQAWADLEL